MTGQRRDEIGSLRWDEIDFDAALISLPPKRTKNRREHQIPLAPAGLAVLKKRQRVRDHVFGKRANGYQGWSASKAPLDQRLSIADWRLHDLRRTVSTIMHDALGIAPHVVEAVLNHVSGHKLGVAGVYNRARYEAQKRHALNAWADHLLALVESRGAVATVVPLHGT